jgi:methionyl-tRNA formyltransferase
VQPPAIKRIATDEGIAVLQPERPRDDAEFAARLAELSPDISIVVAYGHLLSATLIDLPRLGTLNVHASLLPLLRGAAPIQAAIREGLQETGVTIMRMVQRLDAGPMVHQLKTPILEDETGGELALRLSELGALALIEALALMEAGAAAEQQQDESLATYAPKIDRASTRIAWAHPAVQIARIIRAYDPRPGAFAVHRAAEVKLFGAKPVARKDGDEPGTVVAIDAAGMTVACGEGAVQLSVVQPAGKRRLGPLEWSNGRGITIGERLS